MSDNERPGSAIKIEVSDEYMRWLTNWVSERMSKTLRFLFFVVLLGGLGLKTIGLEKVVAILQEVSEFQNPESSPTNPESHTPNSTQANP